MNDTITPMIDTLRKNIDASMAAFLKQVRTEYRLHLVNPILYDSILEYSLREGKRIRPMLLLLAYLGYSRPGKTLSPSVYRASTCIEFLHNFMLIHDDIVDSSDLRRGKPTMHRLLRRAVRCSNPGKLGTDLAIIAGDIVYALAIDAFLSINEDPSRKEAALKYFVQTAAFTAMGEFVDTVHGVDHLKNIEEKDVFLNYALKTARYTFDCPLVTGAILAGSPHREIRKLAAFGLHIGEAFQIQDDVIGMFATEKEIGKSVLSDLEEQKKTILVVHARDHLGGRDKTLFKKLFLKEKKTLHDLEVIKGLLVKSQSLHYALRAVSVREEKSRDILRKLGMNSRHKELVAECLFKFFDQSRAIAARYSIGEAARHSRTGS